MPLSLNFGQIPSNALPSAGSHPFVVEQAEVMRAKQPDEDGNPAYNIKWELRIMDGPDNNKKLWMYSSLKLKNLWGLRSTLINLGFDMDEITDENGSLMLETDTEDEEDPSGVILYPELVGKTGVAVVEESTYNGRPSVNVKQILDSDGVDREKAMREERKASRNGATRERETVAASAPAAPERKKLSLRQ